MPGSVVYGADFIMGKLQANLLYIYSFRNIDPVWAHAQIVVYSSADSRLTTAFSRHRFYVSVSNSTVYNNHYWKFWITLNKMAFLSFFLCYTASPHCQTRLIFGVILSLYCKDLYIKYTVYMSSGTEEGKWCYVRTKRSLLRYFYALAQVNSFQKGCAWRGKMS